MFTIRGTTLRNAIPNSEITWDAGKVRSPDPFLELLAIQTARELEGVAIGPACGPYTTFDHLAEPLSALFVLRMLFVPEPIQIEGDIPQPPATPEGAAI